MDLSALLEWLKTGQSWDRIPRKPGFVFGEGYMRDVDGNAVDISPHSSLRPLVAGTREPIVPVRQTNDMLGYKTVPQGVIPGSDVPIQTHILQSKDKMPTMSQDFWPGTVPSPNMDARDILVRSLLRGS